MPKEQGVFFLQNLVSYDSRFDPSATQRYDPTGYQVNSMQGLIRDAVGTSWVPAQAPGAWPAAHDGKPFDTVLADLPAAGSAMGG